MRNNIDGKSKLALFTELRRSTMWKAFCFRRHSDNCFCLVDHASSNHERVIDLSSSETAIGNGSLLGWLFDWGRQKVSDDDGLGWLTCGGRTKA
uniref:Uncharacterized protein n=1 Tax=Cannabis sativa TaxID=3483 RepID=A0A803PY44_CANSA